MMLIMFELHGYFKHYEQEEILMMSLQESLNLISGGFWLSIKDLTLRISLKGTNLLSFLVILCGIEIQIILAILLEFPCLNFYVICALICLSFGFFILLILCF